MPRVTRKKTTGVHTSAGTTQQDVLVDYNSATPGRRKRGSFALFLLFSGNNKLGAAYRAYVRQYNARMKELLDETREPVIPEQEEEW